jgi:hypothetical protein
MIETDQINPLPSHLSYPSVSHSALSASPLIKPLESQELDMEQRRSRSIVQSKSLRFAIDIAWRIHRRKNDHASLEIAGLLKECDEPLKMLNSIILPIRRKCAAADLRLHSRSQHSAFAEAVDAEPSTSQHLRSRCSPTRAHIPFSSWKIT